MAGLTAAAVPKLKLKWAFGFPDDISAYAQPTVAVGRVFVGSAGGTVYALDAQTGCIRWSYGGLAGVRTAITLASFGGRLVAFFGDLQANLYALDAADGKLLWKRKLDPHPAARITGAPQLSSGRLYVPVASREEWFAANPFYECCTFRGSVAAVDAATGEVIWQTFTIAEAAQVTGKNKFNKPTWGPAGAGVWSAPVIDQGTGLLYAVTGDNYSRPTTAHSDSLLEIGRASCRERV